jgi:hypothetical protein
MVNKLIVCALAPLLIAGAAIAAPPEPKVEQSDPQARRITGSAAYVPTFGLRASIAQGRNLHGVLSVDAGLDAPSSETRRRIAALRPRVMSAMQEAVQSYASFSHEVGTRPDFDLIKARLQKAVDGVIGAGQAKVAIASVIVFPR